MCYSTVACAHKNMFGNGQSVTPITVTCEKVMPVADGRHSVARRRNSTEISDARPVELLRNSPTGLGACACRHARDSIYLTQHSARSFSDLLGILCTLHHQIALVSGIRHKTCPTARHTRFWPAALPALYSPQMWKCGVISNGTRYPCSQSRTGSAHAAPALWHRRPAR